MENKNVTGYPSIDKPWLKYYSEEAINTPLPKRTIYEYLWENNKDHLDDTALIYFGRKITYKELFENIDKTARAFSALGVRQGDTVAMCITNTPESVYCFYSVNKLGAISNMPMHRGETFLCMVPPFILNGLCTCLNLPLSVGVAVQLIPQFKQEDFPKYLKSKPEHVIAAPSWWERLIQDKRMKNTDLSFLITAATGGDGINAENERKLNDFLMDHHSKSILLNGYGMTELGSSVCTGMNHCNCIGSIGIPLPKMTLAIFDENENELKYNKRGELCVSGPSLMNGYCGKASYENSNIKTHNDGSTWIHTGDIAHITEEGFVFIDGRIKRIIIREGGFKVFPNLVENVLIKINGVQNCAVVGMKIRTDLTGQVPVAFIVTSDNQQIIEEQCFHTCKKNLSNHCIPEKIFFLPQLPLTPIGKVDYRALEKLAEEKQMENKNLANI